MTRVAELVASLVRFRKGSLDPFGQQKTPQRGVVVCCLPWPGGLQGFRIQRSGQNSTVKLTRYSPVDGSQSSPFHDTTGFWLCS